MAKTLKIRLNSQSIESAIREIEREKSELKEKAVEIARRLAELGYDVAKVTISGHVHSGETLAGLEVIDRGDGKFALTAASKAILFFEFGAGIRYGAGHPEAAEYGMGPGTYPGSGSWDNENGWWYPTDDAALIIHTDKNGQGWAHTYGNRPHMPMYKAKEQIRQELPRIVQEVFSE